MLADIISRIERATGPDRELDVDLMAAFLPRHKVTTEVGFEELIRVAWAWDSREGIWREVERIPYTASVDAVLALMQRALPDAFWLVDKQCFASVGDGRGKAATPALALLLALLRAYQKESTDDR